LVVVLCYGLYRALASKPQFVMARTPALYVIGGIAAYWSIDRMVGIVA
jgi:hypothetical protein